MKNTKYINHDYVVYLNCDPLKIMKRCDESKEKTILASTKDFIFFNEEVEPTYTEQELIDMNLYNCVIINGV